MRYEVVLADYFTNCKSLHINCDFITTHEKFIYFEKHTDGMSSDIEAIIPISNILSITKCNGDKVPQVITW